MKILLIKPAWFRLGPFHHCVNVRSGPLSLGLIAALSAGHDVKIIDADVEKISFSEEWDLVGISTPTPCALEAYRIADKFRELKVKVVLGGVHPSLMPEEALRHADSVVIGEAESVWGDVLRDFPRLQEKYQSNNLVDIDNLPLARRDLFYEGYKAEAVQATRGCVNQCKYCYLQSVPWKGYRKRSPEKFEREISQIKNPYLFFADDNLFVDHEYVLEIAERISFYKKFWSCQAPINIGERETFVKKLANSGLSGVMLGLDSICKETLDSALKSYSPQYVKQTVKCLHDHKIGVGAMLVFGFDDDNLTVFEKTLEFIEEAQFDSAVFFTLTPYPGTELFKEMERERRIITKDWEQYNWMNTVFEPKQMTSEELTKQVKGMYKRFNRFDFLRFSKKIPFYYQMIRRSPRLAWDLRNYLCLKPPK